MTDQELELRLSAIEEQLDLFFNDEFLRTHPLAKRWVRLRKFIQMVYR